MRLLQITYWSQHVYNKTIESTNFNYNFDYNFLWFETNLYFSNPFLFHDWVASCLQFVWNLISHWRWPPTHSGMVETPQVATDDNCKHAHYQMKVAVHTYMYTVNLKHKRLSMTLSFPSDPDLYKGFQDHFQADQLEQSKQSKNVFNISVKWAVSFGLGPTDIARALATELLRTL